MILDMIVLLARFSRFYLFHSPWWELKPSQSFLFIATLKLKHERLCNSNDRKHASKYAEKISSDK